MSDQIPRRTPAEQDAWELMVDTALGPLDPEYVREQAAFAAEARRALVLEAIDLGVALWCEVHEHRAWCEHNGGCPCSRRPGRHDPKHR